MMSRILDSLNPAMAVLMYYGHIFHSEILGGDTSEDKNGGSVFRTQFGSYFTQAQAEPWELI